MNKFLKKLVLIAFSAVYAYGASAQQQVTAELKTHRTNVYLNETVSITLSVKALNLTLGQGLSLQNMPPDDRLKRISDFETIPVKRESHDNQTIETHEFRISFRPVTQGIIQLAPRLQFTVITRQKSFWGSSTVQQPAAVDVRPLTLSVSELPDAGRPAEFQNAVGNFSFAVKLEPPDVAVGDLVTLLMTVRGTGYLDEIKAPRTGSMKDFKIYEPQTVAESEGLRTFRQILIPASTNACEVAAVSFSFFDPDSGLYKTITQGPFPVTFHPEKNTMLEHFKPVEITDNMENSTNGIMTSQPRAGISGQIERRIRFAAEGFRKTAHKETAMFAPAFSSVPVFEVPENKDVKSLQIHGEWTKIEYNNNRGWIPAAALEPQ